MFSLVKDNDCEIDPSPIFSFPGEIPSEEIEEDQELAVAQRWCRCDHRTFETS